MQWLKIKGSIIDINNCLNSIFLSFDSFNHKFSPGAWLIVFFSLCYLQNKESKDACIHKLDECVFHTLTNSKSVVIVSDASIKNNVTMSIMHIYLHSNPVTKTIHYAVNATFTEAKLFAIRCDINQTT